MVTFIAVFLLVKSQNVIFGCFLIKKPCVLHSKIVHSFKLFAVAKVEGISGTQCQRHWKKMLSHVWTQSRLEVESLKKMKKMNSFYFSCFMILEMLDLIQV